MGFTGVLLGGDWPIFGYNAINFLNNPLMPDGTAITLGNAINYGKGGFPMWAPHEQAHTPQGEILGPAYLPLHIIDKLIHWDLGPSGWLEIGPYSIPPRSWPWK